MHFWNTIDAFQALEIWDRFCKGSTIVFCGFDINGYLTTQTGLRTCVWNWTSSFYNSNGAKLDTLFADTCSMTYNEERERNKHDKNQIYFYGE